MSSMEMTMAGAVKPLLRGWIHAVAAVGAVALTVILGWRSWGDVPKLLSLLTFGASMTLLYTVSAVYHIGHWRDKVWRVLRAMDHSNIFIVIAGSYTPVCVNLLSGVTGTGLLAVIWTLALAGIGLSVAGSIATRLQVPRWTRAALYIGMGWVAVLAIPAFLAVLPPIAIATMVLGGLLYTVGAIVYARKRPNPFPRVLGFHEVFHLFVVAGGATFALFVWLWVMPA